MCGIIGWIDWEENIENNRNILNSMIETLSKRGPDASGIWLSQTAGIGHRRLSVIDPQNGAQPMTRSIGSRQYVITYNGELYNTDEVRKTLFNKGYTFKTNCDTEVVLISYIEWGEECLKYFNGIYSIGIWDELEQSLFLARDRFGVKPLFYSNIDNSFIFASEIKTLLSHPKVSHMIDGNGLSEIFALGPSRTPGNGVFKDIHEIKPAHYLLYDKDGIRIKKYWELKSRPHTDSFDVTVKKVRDLVITAIKRQLVSDVPLCTFLSGGLDSSAITCIASEHLKNNKNEQLNTFSIDYVGNDKYFKADKFQPNSDSQYIKKVSDFANTNHHNIILDINDLEEALYEATLSRDLPGMADIDSSLLLFCREVKKDYTVALSGECADEIFGGYPWFHDSEPLCDNTFPWLRSLQNRLTLFTPEIINKMNPIEYVSSRYNDSIKEVPSLFGEDPVEAKRRQLFYLNMMWFMSTLLDRKDRMSMATGLEVRVPFCDHNIVEYVWNIPWEMKNFDNMEKGIMRKALYGIVPEEVIYRKKSPYPKTHNPYYTELVKNNLLKIINDKSSPLLNIINVQKVHEIIESNGESYTTPWFGQLMKGPQLMAFLIQVDIWMKNYKVEIE